MNQSTVFSVSELSHHVKQALERNFQMLWISGELSNLAMPRSGHWYFTLKDDHSQIRCVMFAQNNQRLNFTPDEGMHIQVQARVSLYEARGEFQLIVESMKDGGIGALQQAFEQLKDKLQTQGFFAIEHKKSLPKIPHCIGIITSPTGAALQDILQVLKRRFPALPIIIYPAQVQGDEAPKQLIHALQLAEQQAICDVLIIGRGGGSIEDLWAFNNEQLALAIFHCAIPVISSVGHEVDVTICDFMADLRASTPSVAAELVSPNQYEWRDHLDIIETQLTRSMNHSLSIRQQKLQGYYQQLKHPNYYLEEVAQRLNDLFTQIEQHLNFYLILQGEKNLTLYARLQHHSPLYQLQQKQNQLTLLQQRLQHSFTAYLDSLQQKIVFFAREMDAFSPLATLGRGYALVKDEHNRLIHSASQLQTGQPIRIHFAHNQVQATIVSLTELKKDDS